MEHRLQHEILEATNEAQAIITPLFRRKTSNLPMFLNVEFVSGDTVVIFVPEDWPFYSYGVLLENNIQFAGSNYDYTINEKFSLKQLLVRCKQKGAFGAYDDV